MFVKSVLMLLDSLFPVLVRHWVCVGVGAVILAAVHSTALFSLLLITVNKHRARLDRTTLRETSVCASVLSREHVCFLFIHISALNYLWLWGVV